MIRRRILLAACLHLGAPLPTAGHPCRPQTRRRGMELQHLLRPGLAGRRCPRTDQRAPPNRTAQRAPCTACLFRVNSWPLALAYCSPLPTPCFMGKSSTRRPKHGVARIFRSPNITISNNQPQTTAPFLRQAQPALRSAWAQFGRDRGDKQGGSALPRPRPHLGRGATPSN
jgi:hypothetical protein